MKKTILALIAIALLATGSWAADPAMKGSAHDLSVGSASPADTTVQQICVFCHTPHNAGTSDLDAPLWNHTISSNATYNTYTSNTMNASPTDIGQATTSSLTVDHLCMSCHDGTIGLGSLYNQPNEGNSSLGTGTKITGDANFGTDLSNDHPINFTYNSALATEDGELVTPGSTSVGAAPLFDGKVACASCHDPHSTTYSYFLVQSHVDSAICAECHQK